RVGVGHHLGDAVMIAQVDEQHSAMVADAVAPAGKPHLLADVICAQDAAGMGAVAVHGDDLTLDAARKGTCAGSLVKNGKAMMAGQRRRRAPAVGITNGYLPGVTVGGIRVRCSPPPPPFPNATSPSHPIFAAPR